ncbi:CLUMA_CG011557, isoform A [Clunio marinus]|uniref:CLUMA_CG011557, isoform A n=1 Tax=Clunio marinus TaxID=568069 RepID=A0A1J1IEJ6_9DIPT|nr:CLUMA_CG011557, isoform A [Clunio marinus]
MTSPTNMTISSQVKMENLLDPDADVTFGFWLNGVGIMLIGLMGIFGNMASIRVLSHKQMRSSPNFILIALASSDLILIITSILLFALTTIYPYNGCLKHYYFVTQPMLAGLTYPVAIIAQTISVYMTFLISFERYIAVCHPLKAKSFCTQTRTKMSIFVIVFMSILYNIPKFFEINLNESQDEEFGKFYYVSASMLRTNKLYITIYINWLYFIFMNLIPLSSITIFNIRIYRQVQIVNRMRVKLTSKERQDIKLTTMLFCVVIVFLCCNCLAVVTNIVETLHIHNDILTKTSNFFVTVNSSVNFIIYVVLVRKFRTIFIREFSSLCGCHDGGMQRGKTRKFFRQLTFSSDNSETIMNETK